MNRRWHVTLATAAVGLAFAPACGYHLAEGALLLLALSLAGGGPRRALQGYGSCWWCLVAASWMLVAATLVSGRLSPWPDVLQAVLLLAVGVTVFRRAAQAAWSPAPIAAGVAGVSLLVALGQAAAGLDAPRIAGLFPGRSSFGVAMAACVPLLLGALARWDGAQRGRRLALLATPLALVLAVWHLPALALALAATLGWAWLSAEARDRRLVLGGLLLGLVLLASPGLSSSARQREALAASVVTVDRAGYPRRWVLEMRAAQAAVAAAPWLGHGPGSYQKVVSSGRFRSALPPTVENTVERATQCGYVVLAVEYGLPLALLVAGALLFAIQRAWRLSPAAAGKVSPGNPAGRAPELALCLLVLLCGLVVTPLLVSGIGVLVAALLGAALGRCDRPCPEPATELAASAEGSAPEALPEWEARPPTPMPAAIPCPAVADTAWVQSLVLLAAVALAVAWVALGGGRHAEPATARASAAPGGGSAGPTAPVLMLEAEAAAGLEASHLVKAPHPDASAGYCLEVNQADKETLLADGGRELRVHAEQDGPRRLWLRCWWPDGCANSIAVGLDGAAPVLVGNDGTYTTWHWVAGPELSLTAGAHVLRLLPREALARVDVVALVEGPGEPPGLAAPASAPPAAAAWPRSAQLQTTGRPERQRFVAGVGGTYAPGPEAVLMQLGVPAERLQSEDLANAEALGAYDLVWITKPGMPTGNVWGALHTYVRRGGIAILEQMVEPLGGTSDSGGADRHALLPAGDLGSDVTGYRGHRVRVSANGSPLFADLPADAEVYEDVSTSVLPALPTDAGESHGQLLQGRRPFGVALTKRRLDRGTVYALGLPLGFISMWRGTQFDAVARRLVMDAVGDRYSSLFERFAYTPVQSGTVHFADDFMRSPGEFGAWEKLAGTCEQIGGPPPAPPQYSRRRLDPGPPNALSVRLTAPALMSAGNPEWRDYRVRAAVLADGGDGGIWATSSSGRQVQARVCGSEGLVRLVTLAGSAEEVLAEEALPAPRRGWRRLSLWHDGDAWQVWLDGLPRLRRPAPGETASGRFGLVATAGIVHLDDVIVRDAAALVPGTDACLGEEGSCRADYAQRDGVERRSVCSPLWALRPDPLGRHAVQPLLPVPGPAELVMDGEVLGSVEGNAGRPVLYLPAGRTPSRDLALVVPAWHDYLFGGQQVDWYGTGGTWERVPRWSCDQQWEWLGIRQGPPPAILWYRPSLSPPYAIATEAAMAMRGTQGDDDFDETPRDLNLVLAGGNGEDLRGAWILQTGRAGNEGCRVLRDGQVLAQNPAVGLPPEGGHALHHRWIRLQATVEPRRLQVWFDGRPAVTCDLDQDLPGGRVGVWTQDNAIQIARVLLAAARPAAGRD